MVRTNALVRAGLAFAAVSVVLGSCADSTDAPTELGTTVQSLHGVPQNGYPNYQERLTLMAINRTRSDPNNVTAGTMAACSANYAATKPLVWSYEGSRAARFHCQNLMLTQSGLAHNSYCTLNTDIAATNCDGSAACACVPGSEHFNCTTLGSSGTSASTRCSYFSYPMNGEVGAAGYGDGWSANQGWVTECAGADGHRSILTGSNKDTIGLGYAQGSGCWGRYYFGDTANRSVVTPALPSGIHRPELGSATTSFDFYVAYHDPAATPALPNSVHVVIDGVCKPMTKEIGVSPNNITYKYSEVVGTGCHQYWFLARDSANARHVWPEVGSWGVGSCADYNPTALTADCDSCTPGATKPCGAGACIGTSMCQPDTTWGACNGPPPAASESCNGVDDDCDGILPANERDADGDGVRGCAGDCDDTDRNVHPGATEICDGKDDDCDGSKGADEADTDKDGVPVCAGDCDDNDGARRPGASEICDGKDNDCSGAPAPDEVDGDGDGTRLCAGDCDDVNPAVRPGATEACNNVDDNCDRTVDENCACSPNNSTQACGSAVGACAPGSQKCQGGTWRACAGGTAPGTEICRDGQDNDCDGFTDESCPAPWDGGFPPPGPDASTPLPGPDAATVRPDAAAPRPDAGVQPGADAGAPAGPDAAAQPSDDAGTQPEVDSGATPEPDAEVPAGEDASAPVNQDAAVTPGADASSVTADAATEPSDAAVAEADAGDDSATIKSGCGCGAASASTAPWALVAVAGALLGRRRKP